MKIRVVPRSELAAAGARLVADALARAGRRDATLMPALGSSALGVYHALADMRRDGTLDTSGLRLIQLDEYAGIAAEDPRSLLRWLRRDVAGPLGVPDGRIIPLRCDDPDLAYACRRYDESVAAAGGIDIAVLGLGPNGHLGFNEPPSDADAPTRLTPLAPASLTSNARYWPGLDVPEAALTAGMSTILAARWILLVVTGASKRPILERTLRGPITPDVPASLLRRHGNAVVLADPDAWPHGAEP